MSSRQEQKEAARASREQEQEQAALTASRRRRLQLVGGGVAALLLVIGAVAFAVSSGDGDEPDTDEVAVTLPAPKTTDLKAAATEAGGTLKSFDWDEGSGEHTTDPVEYPMNPPTNGPHNPVWAADGNYAGRTTPPVEELVHSLEHGRILIQYRPGLPPEQVAQLQALFDESPEHMLLLQNNTDMKGDVAATAWGHSLVIPAFNERGFDAIRAFREQYRDKGPEFVA